MKEEILNRKPKTLEEAYENGKNSHTEGQNPFRNMSVEFYKLNNAWYDGFESRKNN